VRLRLHESSEEGWSEGAGRGGSRVEREVGGKKEEMKEMSESLEDNIHGIPSARSLDPRARITHGGSAWEDHRLLCTYVQT
jgi:hypothetical protein